MSVARVDDSLFFKTSVYGYVQGVGKFAWNGIRDRLTKIAIPVTSSQTDETRRLAVKAEVSVVFRRHLLRFHLLIGHLGVMGRIWVVGRRAEGSVGIWRAHLYSSSDDLWSENLK